MNSFQNGLLEYRTRQTNKLTRVVIIDRLGYQGRPRYKPIESEMRPCCERYVGYKHLFNHLRSAKHIANPYGLDETEFIRYVRVREIARTRGMRRQSTQ